MIIIALLTKSRGAIGSRVQALLQYIILGDNYIMSMRLREWMFFIQYY